MKKILLLILVLRGAPSAALVVSQRAVENQLARAPLVADLRIESRETVLDAERIPHTRSVAEVLAVVAIRDDGGAFPHAGDRITVETLGGESEGTGMLVPGLPRPFLGHRYRAYLDRAPSGSAFRVAGFEHGLRDAASATRTYTRNRTDGSNGTGTGAFLYWNPSHFPIPYFVSAPSFAGHPEFADAIDESMQAWSTPDNVILDFVAMGCSDSTRNANDGINNIVLVTGEWPFDQDAIAITRNFYVADTSNRSGMILDSDILLNGLDHRFSTNNEPGTHDVQNIVTHEAGHFIGLGHETTTGDIDATMYAQASQNEFNKRTLKVSDIAGLRAGYSGVTPKIPRTRTRDLCTIATSENVGCARVHGRREAGAGFGWLGVWVVMTLGAARFARRLTSIS